MADGGGFYEAQSPSFPNVGGPSVEIGTPQLIKPEDWYRMWQGMGGYTGSMLPELTKITQAGTSLVDNAYKQEMDYAKARADLGRTVADTKYYEQATQNMAAEQAQRERLYPFLLKQQKQKTRSDELVLDTQEKTHDFNQKALDEYPSYYEALTKLDPIAPDYYQKKAEIDAQFPNASGNPTTRGYTQGLIEQHLQQRGVSTKNKEVADQHAQLLALKENDLIPRSTDIDTEVARGSGPALITLGKTNYALHRLVNLKENTTDPVAKTWAQTQIDNILGNNIMGGDKPDPVVDANGNLLSGIEGKLNSYERDANIPTAADITGKGTKAVAPKVIYTQKYNETSGKWETQRVVTTEPGTGEQTTAEQAQTAAQTDVSKDPVLDQAYKQTLAEMGKGVSVDSKEFKDKVWANYVAEKQRRNEPIPGLTTTAGGGGQSSLQGRTFDQLNEEERQRVYKHAEEMGTSDLIAAQADLVQKEGAQAEKPVPPKNEPPVAKNAEEEKKRLRSRFFRGSPVKEPKEVPIPERKPTGVGPHYGRRDRFESSQVQNAPSIQLASTSVDEIDGWHTYRLGNATTFGLNYDGSIDTEDNGRGAFGYNTRDPRLVGASINVPEMMRMFPNDVWIGSDGEIHMSERLRDAGRNGDLLVQVTDPRSGLSVRMPLVDIGPGRRTGARLDLTHAASHIFRTGGKSILAYRLVDGTGHPIEV
jgi:hypothetical protein